MPWRTKQGLEKGNVSLVWSFNLAHCEHENLNATKENSVLAGCATHKLKDKCRKAEAFRVAPEGRSQHSLLILHVAQDAEFKVKDTWTHPSN